MLATHRQLGTIVNSVDRFIALTHFSRHKFIQGGIPPEKITVKPNFVDPDPCTRTQRGEYALFVGRLSPEKRVSTLLLAWQKLRSQIPLLIIGGGPLQTELLGLAQRLGLSNVHIQGALPRQETLEAMNRARFLLFCSEWYENFPCTLAEAFACRTPVITSRLGAMEEIVEDGRTGLHFTAGDADDLAEKVDWAWRHPGQMSEIGEQARREYETKYTADQNYAMLMEIYRHAMRSGPAPIEVQEPMSIPG
jgi:glycosyltransferase involved in cell wall biosynthesis